MTAAYIVEPDDSNSAPLMSIVEAAQFLGLSRSVIYRLMDTGELPSYKIGKRRVLKRADILEFIDNLPLAVSAR